MSWLNWSLKFHIRLRTVSLLVSTHITHVYVQWMPYSFVWLYLIKCVVHTQSYADQTQKKKIWIFLVVFGKCFCNDPIPPMYILFTLGPHTPHGFVLPQNTQQWGKRPLHIEGRSFLINTFSCASLGNVGFHGMQDPSFWVTTIHPPYGHTRPRVWDPHFRLEHGSDTIYNDPALTM